LSTCPELSGRYANLQAACEDFFPGADTTEDEMARILAVDDSPSIRQMVSAALTGGGHSVEQAGDGREALEAARREVFDVVITDINMPNMDGITLVKELRGLGTYNVVPLLILTTDGTADCKTRGRKAGATGWLMKPFSPDRLLEVIAKVLR
jgi:two-component system chemotaxis response regulator CheY